MSLTLPQTKKLDMSILKAERTISGTVTLTSPPSSDSYFYVDVYGYRGDIESCYVSIPLSKGQKTAEYSIGVGKGIYELYAYIDNGVSGYYSIYGDIDDWENMCYIDTGSESRNNIDFEYAFGADSDNNKHKSVKASLELASTVNERKSYSLFYEVGGEHSTYSSKVINAGEKGFNMNISLPMDKPVYVGVVERTYTTGGYNSGIAYYYSKQFGVTTDKNAATAINVSDISSLDIVFPKSYQLSGTVYRNGISEGENLDLFVIAQWGSERFYTNVRMDSQKDSADYVINIPAWAQGEEISIYSKLRSVDGGLELSATGEPVSIIASGDKSGLDISAPPSTSTVKMSGNINLGAPAPEGGVIVTVSNYNTVGEGDSRYLIDTAIYLVNEGEQSVPYSAYVPVCDSVMDNNGSLELNISTDANGEMYDSSMLEELDVTELENYDIEIPYLDKSVSGSVILPEGTKLVSGMTFDVSVWYTYNGVSQSLYYNNSIMKGQSCADYIIYVPSGAVIEQISMYPESTGRLGVSSNTLYYSPDGTTENYKEIDMTVTDDIKNIDFELLPAKLITGKIIVPDDFEGNNYCSIYASGNASYSYSSVRIDGPGEYEYTIAVPLDETSAILSLKLSDWYETNYYTGELYYAASGLVYSYQDADAIALTGDITEGIDMELVKGKAVRGKLTFGDGAYLDGEIKAKVNISNDYVNTNKQYTIKSADGVDFNINIPDSEDSNVILSVEIYSYGDVNTNIARGVYYYNGNPQMVTDRTSAVKINVSDGYETNLIIPLGKCVSGQIVLPENAKGKVKSAQLYFEGKVNDISVTVSPDENGYYETYIFPEDSWYSVGLRPNEFTEITNIKDQSYYYVDANNSTTEYSYAEWIDLTNGAQNVNFYLETGRAISGKVIIPEGIKANGRAHIYVKDCTTGQKDSYTVSVFGNETEFMIVPDNIIGKEVVISYNIYGIDGIFSEMYYYTSSGPSLDENKATHVAFGDDGISGIELKAVKSLGKLRFVPKRWNLSGEEYLYVDTILKYDIGYEQHINLYVYSGGDSGDVRVLSVSDAEETAGATSFNISIVVDGARWYLKENGAFTKNEAEAMSYKLEDASIEVPIPDSTINYPDMLGENLYVRATEAIAYKDSNTIVIKTRVGANGMNSNYIIPNSYIGVYDGGRLVKVLSGEYGVINASEYDLTYSGEYDLEMRIEADINENYTYKLFTWNNLQMAAPMAETVEVTIQ